MSSNNVPWAECAPGEEIVITGMSGVFPDSENTQHFYENLMGKVDLTSEDGRRWKTSKFR